MKSRNKNINASYSFALSCLLPLSPIWVHPLFVRERKKERERERERGRERESVHSRKQMYNAVAAVAAAAIMLHRPTA